MIHQLNIIARIAPHPTHYNKAREAICEIIEQTRAEPGCMEFRLSENAQDGTLRRHWHRTTINHTPGPSLKPTGTGWQKSRKSFISVRFGKADVLS